jgi:hypothetical protein
VGRTGHSRCAAGPTGVGPGSADTGVRTGRLCVTCAGVAADHRLFTHTVTEAMVDASGEILLAELRFTLVAPGCRASLSRDPCQPLLEPQVPELVHRADLA